MILRLLISVPMALLLVAADDPRDFRIAGKRFKEADIIDARPLPDTNGTAAILLTLDGKAAKRLTKISKKNRQKPIIIALDGKTLVRPVMHNIIFDGVLQLSGLFSLDEATRLARRISGKDPLPETLDEGP